MNGLFDYRGAAVSATVFPTTLHNRSDKFEKIWNILEEHVDTDVSGESPSQETSMTARDDLDGKDSR